MNSRFPHPLTLLVACVLLAAALSYLLPAGRFERKQDSATGRQVVIANTYRTVERTPVGPFQAMVAIPKGLADAASVVFLVFLVGGAFTVVDKTGALRRAVDALVHILADREALVIPVCCLAFGLCGALENMEEEIIAFVPLLLLLTRRIGFDALTAVAMSIGSAMVGAAFSPINPFQVQIAQKLAQLPLASGWAFRLLFLSLAMGFWIWGTLRHARRTRIAPDRIELQSAEPFGWRAISILVLVTGSFAIFVYGILGLGWDFEQMSALFFVMGVAAGLLGQLGLEGTVEAFTEGFRSMALAALLIGFARAISVVMEEGQIIDTVVQGLSAPLSSLPVMFSAIGIMGVETAIHVPVPSVSGEAVLTMPVLIPLSDLLGLSRQVTVLAYQYGAGLCELLTPTNGALMAMLVASGVQFDRWLRFLVPIYLGLVGLAAIALVAAVSVGLR